MDDLQAQNSDKATPGNQGEVIQGEPLSPQDLAQLETVRKLGQAVIAAVKAGNLKLDKSRIDGNTLFVGVEDQNLFIAVGPDFVQLTESPTEKAKHLGILSEDILKVGLALCEWLLIIPADKTSDEVEQLILDSLSLL